MTALLSARALEVVAGGRRLVGPADLDVEPAQAHVVLGESGSGKTVLLRALVGLEAPTLSVRGRVARLGEDVDLSRRRSSLGRTAVYLPQEASVALNPVRRVEAQLAETLRHVGSTRTPGQLLERVGLGDPQLLRRFPSQLSGGQAQRVLLALALAAEPQLLIADEPTTALDSPHRAAVLTTFSELVASGVAVLLVTHDLDAAQALGTGGRVTVLFAGAIVEDGPGAQVLRRPRHPYTKRLLELKLGLGTPTPTLSPVDGLPPAAQGCAYAPRCPKAQARCVAEMPSLVDGVACFFPEVA